jgi:hypothetical protein
MWRWNQFRRFLKPFAKFDRHNLKRSKDNGGFFGCVRYLPSPLLYPTSFGFYGFLRT